MGGDAAQWGEIAVEGEAGVRSRDGAVGAGEGMARLRVEVSGLGDGRRTVAMVWTRCAVVFGGGWWVLRGLGWQGHQVVARVRCAALCVESVFAWVSLE